MAGERPPKDPDRIPTGIELTALDPTFRRIDPEGFWARRAFCKYRPHNH
jgi:hypothetical protein